jgi:hypothetical protein
VGPARLAALAAGCVNGPAGITAEALLRESLRQLQDGLVAAIVRGTVSAATELTESVVEALGASAPGALSAADGELLAALLPPLAPAPAPAPTPTPHGLALPQQHHQPSPAASTASTLTLYTTPQAHAGAGAGASTATTTSSLSGRSPSVAVVTAPVLTGAGGDRYPSRAGSHELAEVIGASPLPAALLPAQPSAGSSGGKRQRDEDVAAAVAAPVSGGGGFSVGATGGSAPKRAAVASRSLSSPAPRHIYINCGGGGGGGGSVSGSRSRDDPHVAFVVSLLRCPPVQLREEAARGWLRGSVIAQHMRDAGPGKLPAGAGGFADWARRLPGVETRPGDNGQVFLRLTSASVSASAASLTAAAARAQHRQ